MSERRDTCGECDACLDGRPGECELFPWRELSEAERDAERERAIGDIKLDIQDADL
jgi:hypothetical protein